MDYKLLLTHILIIIMIAECQEDAQSNETIHTKCDAEKICLDIYECPVVLKIIKTLSQNSSNDRDSNELRKLLCGSKGKSTLVCCPKDTESLIVFTSDEVATNRPIPSTTPSPITKVPLYVNKELAIEQADPFPGRNVCGLTSLADRIVGGTIAYVDDFPWLARILRHGRKGPFSDFFCHASLITDRYLISAAHCFQVEHELRVRLGEWNVDSPGECYQGVCSDMPVEIEVEEVILHPAFDISDRVYADIALIRLKESVNFTEFIQPVCLPTTDYVKMQDYQRGSEFTAAGWGVTEFDSPSPIKRKVQLPAVAMDICKSAMPSLRKSILSGSICAGGRKGQDTCKGDSGGPLMREVTENYVSNWYLYGITSSGTKQCGSEGFPALYTRVAPFMDWIRDLVKKGTFKT